MAKVILSYRKFNTGDTARRIQSILASAFGPNNVIAGTESLINYNTSGENVVIEAVMDSDAVLVLIDQNWLAGGWANDYTDADVVALNTALYDPSSRVIPLLLDGAAMPSSSQLPVNLQELARQQPLRISSTTLDSDMRRLIQALDPYAQVPPAQNNAYGFPQASPQQQPVQMYQYKSSTTDPNTVFVIELIAGLFGLLGVGHMINGQITQGIGYMVGYWIWAVIAFLLTIATLGIFGCLAFPISLGIIIYSANQAKQYAQGR